MVNAAAALTAGLSLLLGLAGGMDTLCGQAYGAQNYPYIGIVMQRAMLINFAVAVPIVLLWTQMSSILVFLRQSAEIAPLAAKYMLLSVPQLLLAIVTTAVEKFQTTQVCTPHAVQLRHSKATCHCS